MIKDHELPIHPKMCTDHELPIHLKFVQLSLLDVPYC